MAVEVIGDQNLLSLVRAFTRRIVNGRTPRSIFRHGMSEMRELKAEIHLVEAGQPEGDDGIVGEAMDVILCKLDLIFKHRPDIEDAELLALALRKCEKWERKYREKTSDELR